MMIFMLFFSSPTIICAVVYNTVRNLNVYQPESLSECFSLLNFTEVDNTDVFFNKQQ